MKTCELCEATDSQIASDPLRWRSKRALLCPLLSPAYVNYAKYGLNEVVSCLLLILTGSVSALLLLEERLGMWSQPSLTILSETLRIGSKTRKTKTRIAFGRKLCERRTDPLPANGGNFKKLSRNWKKFGLFETGSHSDFQPLSQANLYMLTKRQLVALFARSNAKPNWTCVPELYPFETCMFCCSFVVKVAMSDTSLLAIFLESPGT